MSPAGNIAGTIRDREHKPLSGIKVQAFAFDRKDKRESSPLRTAITNSNGTYSIEPLPAGKYIVGVNADAYQDEDVYPPTLYQSGRAIGLEESGSAKGIDFDLPPPRIAAQLQVTVVDLDGKPFKGASLRLNSPEGEERWVSLKESGADGQFTAPVYMGTQYTVKATYYGSRTANLEGSVQLSVTYKNPSVVIVLKPK